MFCVGFFVYPSLNEILMRVVKNVTSYMQSEASYPFELKGYLGINNE